MIDKGKRNLLGVLIDTVDYEAATNRIIEAAKEGRPCSASALAVHGVMTGVGDREHRYRLNNLDMVTADGQPVRWAVNLLYGTKLPDRVYGPTLTLRVCEAAAAEGLPIFFYGSNRTTLDGLARRLQQRWPKLKVAGWEPSKFRQTTAEEKDAIAERIRGSGARITFVGLGCPRQETFAHEYRDALGMPILAVGAAFDYHSGELEEPPDWVQRRGLQWLYRLVQDPKRLWKRYVLLNPAYMSLVSLQKAGLWRPDPFATEPPRNELLYG